jgi:hypothetical protein
MAELLEKMKEKIEKYLQSLNLWKQVWHRRTFIHQNREIESYTLFVWPFDKLFYFPDETYYLRIHSYIPKTMLTAREYSDGKNPTVEFCNFNLEKINGNEFKLEYEFGKQDTTLEDLQLKLSRIFLQKPKPSLQAEKPKHDHPTEPIESAKKTAQDHNQTNEEIVKILSRILDVVKQIHDEQHR